MKNRFLLSIVLLTACFFSCQKESMTANNEQQSVAIVNKQNEGGGGINTSCGEWGVSSFTQNGEDNSSIFNGYTFTFCSDHTVTATNGTLTANGTWSTNGAESGNNVIYFMTLYFTTQNSDMPYPLTILNAEWKLVEMTNNIIDLKRSTGDENFEVIFNKKG